MGLCGGHEGRNCISVVRIDRDDERVLVVAPHPDDAEIAAFGFYADTRAMVVTVTAGDASDRYQNSTKPWMSFCGAPLLSGLVYWIA